MAHPSRDRLIEALARLVDRVGRSPRDEAARDRGALAARIARRAGMAALVALPGAMTLFLSFNGGGFFAGTTGAVALVAIVAMVLRVTLSDRPFEGFGAPLAVAVVALGLFAVWTFVSFTWSDAPSRAMLEFDRALLYLVVLALAGSMLRTPERVRWMLRCIALAIVVVCTVALITRVLPQVWPISPSTGADRLSYPLTYWNALGLLAAFGIVLALFLTTDELEPRFSRVLAAAALPLVGATLVLTFSRGATVVALLAVVAFALIGRPRGLLSGLLAAGPATAVAVVLAYRADLLGTAEYTSAAAVEQGEEVALGVAVCSLAAFLLRLLLMPMDRALARVQVAPRMRRAVLGGGTAVAVITAVALATALDAPGYVERQYERFVQGSAVAPTATARGRLTNPANNGRIDLWTLSRDAWRRDRLHGSGAGTFQTLWARYRPDASSATDAHSLYMEVLAELGIVGLLLLATAIAAILARLAYLARGPNRALYAAILAAGIAWACHAGIDWDWEMPAVTLPFFAIGGLALASDTRRLGSPARLTRVVLGIGLLALAVTPALIVVSQSRLNASVRAFKQGDCDLAIDRALSAASVLRVRPEPYEILAYCDARRRGAGRLAVQMMEQAVKRDPDNWEFHYGLALVRGATRLDPRPAAQAAHRLNPRSQLTRDAVERFDTSDPEKWERRARRARLSL